MSRAECSHGDRTERTVVKASAAVWAALSAALLAGACAPPTPEQSVVVDAVTALGGNRVTRVRTLSVQAEGMNGNLGQDVTPEATAQAFRITGYVRRVDWTGGRPRVRIEQTRTPNFEYYLGQAPQRQVFGLDGDVAYRVDPAGNATRAPETVARDWRAELYHHPLTAVRAAVEPGARLANARTEGDERLVDVTTTDGVTFVLATDGSTHVPTRVISRTDQPNLGDVTIETRFADYQVVDGVRLPARLTTRVDDYTNADLQVTSQAVDGDVGDLSAPASAASAQAPSAPAPNVTVEEAAPGIWLLAGQSHHSALVELSDHLVLIEAPQSEARTLAVIAKARELRPDKPLTTLINTHHHFDHSAGIRAAVSEGLSVITHAGNEAFIRSITGRPHTIEPDALARKPAPLTLETVTGERTIEDPSMTLVLYPVDGNPHSETMLMVYVPKHRLLIQADGFSPGFEIQPYAPNLIENITRRRLRVETVVPLHGEITPYSELEKWRQTS